MKGQIVLGVVDADNKTGANLVFSLNPAWFDFTVIREAIGIVGASGYSITIIGLQISLVATSLNGFTADDIQRAVDSVNEDLSDSEIPEPVLIDWERERHERLMFERLDSYVYCLKVSDYFIEPNLIGNAFLQSKNKSDAMLFTYHSLMGFAKKYPGIYANCEVCLFDNFDVVSYPETL